MQADRRDVPGGFGSRKDEPDPLPAFQYALDATVPTITSGGWAKHVTVRRFPAARGISGVHMFLDPGGSRELHWHSLADEWAYVIDGRCQTVVLTPQGTSEINNLGPGDLWYFPKGHGHSIQTIGDEPCHFILAFNDGEESPEFGTFGITDWISVTPKDWLAQTFGMLEERFDTFPRGKFISSPVRYCRRPTRWKRRGPKSRPISSRSAKIPPRCAPSTEGASGSRRRRNGRSRPACAAD